MTKIKFLLAIMVFICLSVPAYHTFAQENTSETQITTTQNDETETSKEKKADKKKDKEKDTVDVSEKFFWSLLINIATLLLIIIFIYYPNNREIESIFTFFMFNLMIFMLTFVLNKIKMSMGAAFGLFAVFSMLRYRTEGISMKDMTYLFIFIAVGLISAIQLEYFELGIISGIIIVFTFILDGNIIFKRESSKRVEYENIDLIKPQNYPEMLDDLKKRTGLNIHRAAIEKIDFLRDTASVRIFFYEK